MVAYGMWPSLERRLLWEQESAGSNPAIPTTMQAIDWSFMSSYCVCGCVLCKMRVHCHRRKRGCDA